MKRMSKNVSQHEWEALRYPITLHQLSEEEGGGWLATIPLLGEAAFMADGETTTDALQNLEALRRDLYEDVIASGQPIPIPQDVTEGKSLPSGRWIMRTSPQFHAELQEAAKAADMSLNAYCNHVLERGHAISSMYRASEDAIRATIGEITLRAAQAVPLEAPNSRPVSWEVSPSRKNCQFDTSDNIQKKPYVLQTNPGSHRMAQGS